MQKQTAKEVLASRHIEGYLDMPGQDNFKLGLAVEGGAMKSIVSAGMLLALRDLGLIDLFDIYTGTSGGNFNLAYVLSGEGDNGISLYYDHLIQKEIIDLGRLAPGGNTVMDMQKVEELIFSKEPFNFEALKSKYADKLFITVTNISELTPEIFKLSDAKTYRDLLMASSTIPIVSGKARTIAGKAYVDAGFAYPNPAMAAHELGCSHVILLSTQKVAKQADKSNKLYEAYKKVAEREYPGLRSFVDRRYTEFVANIHDDSEEGFIYKDTAVTNISVPLDAVVPGRLSNDPWKLIQGVRAGYQAALDIFYPGAQTSMIPKLIPRTKKVL